MLILFALMLLLTTSACAMEDMGTLTTFKPDIDHPDATCGKILYVDYGSAADGPAYYTDKRGNIISHCGGLRRAQPGDKREECPPKAWTCEQPPAQTRNNHVQQ